jgi:isoquinoline 1-oxidoreductase subunit beta
MLDPAMLDANEMDTAATGASALAAASEPSNRDAARLTRRRFVHGALALGGGLALAVKLPLQAAAAEPGAAAPVRPPSAFLHIGEDNLITLTTPAEEMGQGGHTSVAMIIMEELGGDWQQLHVQNAPAAAVYDNPMFGQQSTVGSFTVRGWYHEARRIGAAARTMLLQAAAAKWRVPASECSAAHSLITHAESGRSCTFGSVAARAARLPVPQQPVLKPAASFTLIGTSPPRVDVPDKVDGSARYGIDVRLPGMLYAAIRQCPTFGGRVRSIDDSGAREIPGYHSTVKLPDAVIVVANSYWRARKALDRVRVEYDLGPLATLDSARVSQKLREGVRQGGASTRNDGDAAAALAAAASTLEAVYEVPYLAHACMEPMNCTARLDAQGGEVWCSTQAPQAAQKAAAAAFGIAPERVQVHSMYVGGGFGRRGEADFAAQAAAAAKAVGQPVKLVWTREEDIQHDFYRPAQAIRFRAGVDRDGHLTALDCAVATASTPGFARGASFYTEGIADANYEVPNFHVTGVNKDLGVRFGFWRSVNYSHNPFMLESFIDEVAHHVGQDPYRFRRALLQHERARRQLALLDLLAEKAGWDHPAPGHHFGIAALEGFGSYAGSVVEVTAEDRHITVHRVLMAIDCGVTVHPDNTRAQLEGGMVYGLSAALRGEITLERGAVLQNNFNDYPVVTLAEMPRIDCYIMPSSAAPGGVGEPGTGPIAPALANAIFTATGVRARTLPLSKLGFTFAVQRA